MKCYVLYDIWDREESQDFIHIGDDTEEICILEFCNYFLQFLSRERMEAPLEVKNGIALILVK
jgi:hypothetical protein